MKEIILDANSYGERTSKGERSFHFSGAKWDDESGDTYTTVEIGVRNGKEFVVTIFKRKKHLTAVSYVIPVRNLSALLEYLKTGEELSDKSII